MTVTKNLPLSLMKYLRHFMISFCVVGLSTAAAQSPDDVALIKGVSATRAKGDYIIRTVGRLQSKQQLSVVAEVAAKVQTLGRLDVGQRYKAGDLMLSLDDSNYQAALKQAEAALMVARVDHEIARADFDRNEEVYRGGNLSESAYDLSRARVEKTKAMIAQAEAQRAVAQKNVERTHLKAPFDAVVSKRMVTTDSYVAPGQVLFELLDVSAAQIIASVSPDEAKTLAAMMQEQSGSEIQLMARPNDASVGSVAFKGVLEGFSPLVDARSRSAMIIARFDDVFDAQNNGVVYADDFMDVEIPARYSAQVWMVPHGVIRRGSYVWVVEKGQLRKQAVKIVGTLKGQALISSDRDLATAIIMDTQLADEREGMAVRLNTRSSAQ